VIAACPKTKVLWVLLPVRETVDRVPPVRSAASKLVRVMYHPGRMEQTMAASNAAPAANPKLWIFKAASDNRGISPGDHLTRNRMASCAISSPPQAAIAPATAPSAANCNRICAGRAPNAARVAISCRREARATETNCQR